MFCQDDELPPKAFLDQIINELTKIYCFLWEKKNSDNRVDMAWKDLSRYYNKNTFRTALRKLCTQGLLSYNEYDGGVIIELVDWKDLEE